MVQERRKKNTYNSVFNLRVHEKSSVFVGDQRPVLAGKNVGKILQISSSIFAGRKVGHKSFAHGVDDWSPTPTLAFHHLLQLLKLMKIIKIYVFWNKWKQLKLSVWSVMSSRLNFR